mgnify:CR=1 FL=1
MTQLGMTRIPSELMVKSAKLSATNVGNHLATILLGKFSANAADALHLEEDALGNP